MPDYSTEFNSIPLDMGGGGGAPQGGGLDVKRMIRLRAPLMITLFLVVAVPSVFLIYFLSPTEYTVSAELVFRANTPRVLDDTSQRESVPYDKFVSTQIQMITGPTILSRVLDKPAIRELPELAEAPDKLQFLRDRIRAYVNRGSELVTVSMRMKDKHAAAQVLDQVITTYLDYARERARDMDYDRRQVLKDTIESQRRRLQAQEDLVKDLQSDIGVPLDSVGQVGPNEAEAYRQFHAQAMTDLNEAKSRVSQIESQLEALKKLESRYEESPSKPIYEQGIEKAVGSDPRVASVREMEQSRETEIELESERLGPQHPSLAKLQEDRETLARKVQQAEVKVRGEVLEAKRAELEFQLDSERESMKEAQQRVDQFNEKLTSFEDKFAETSKKMATLETEQEEKKRIITTINRLESQLEEMNIESNAPARINLASEPVIPSGPDQSKMLQMMVLAVLGAGGLSVAAGLFRELTDQKTRAPQDLSGITSLPILAAIPDGRYERLPKQYHAPLLAADHPQSPTADEYRRILSRIIYPPDDTVEVNTCLIASPTRGDGKTTLACNLAVSLAQANRRVLLIDVCPRDPSVEWSFGLEPAEGLSEVLLEHISYKMLVRSTEFPSLKVLGPGFHADGLTGKLASRDMMEFIELAEKDFDHVLIDTPPALIMSDAKLLAPVVDGVVVTVGADASSRGMVRRCLREFEQVNANIIGLVLNGIRPTRGGYMKRNLDLFYDYPKRDGEKIDREFPEIRVADFEPVSGSDEEPDEAPPVMLLAEDEMDEPAEEAPRSSNFGG